LIETFLSAYGSYRFVSGTLNINDSMVLQVYAVEQEEL